MKQNNLYKNTISNTLWEVLNKLMAIDLLSSFRLVGGTALSLQLGHRMSVDIDLFTDAEYGSIDFEAIDQRLQKEFPYVEMLYFGNESFGKSYYIGENKENIVKVDLFYTDSFIQPIIQVENIRIASIEEISAMKIEIIGNDGRKKDFWDIHELLEILTLEQIIELFEKRHP